MPYGGASLQVLIHSDMPRLLKSFLNSVLPLTLLLCLQAGSSDAQVSSSRKYRVIAYKTGQAQVFSISNEVEIVPAITLYVPNTFTPNGDGLNDTFGVAGEAIKDFRMQIFNRWGQLIFESSNANERWDGTFQGQKVPMGTYVYKVTASSPNGMRQNKEGNLNVIM
ncbi:MAG: gliding motility-associated C-terminal domain-containing protein [Bacteroidia bacterium]|nr:gliding motility-associated C-terminal domain-containing protein [Bacteroidia bacterium]